MNKSKTLKLSAAALLWLLAVTAHAAHHSCPRTILISFDGAQPQVIEQLLRNKKLAGNGGFATLIREGTQATHASKLFRIPTSAAAMPGYIEEAYRIAESNLKAIIDAAKLGKTNIIAVSDHGMSPFTRKVLQIESSAPPGCCR